MLFLIWLGNLLKKKMYISFSKRKKKFNWFVDLVFEICLDSEFSVEGEILKKCLP